MRVAQTALKLDLSACRPEADTCSHAAEAQADLKDEQHEAQQLQQQQQMSDPDCEPEALTGDAVSVAQEEREVQTAVR